MRRRQPFFFFFADAGWAMRAAGCQAGDLVLRRVAAGEHGEDVVPGGEAVQGGEPGGAHHPVRDRSVRRMLDGLISRWMIGLSASPSYRNIRQTLGC